jgi:hypothetical protein
MDPTPSTHTYQDSDSDTEDINPTEFCENLLIMTSFVMGILCMFMIPV